MSIRIVLVDDHRVIRDGLRNLIEQQPDMKVVAEAEDGREAVKMVTEHEPDIVVMDISMPNLNGIEATHRIKIDHPKTQIIALSMHPDKQFVHGMLNAGASGYLLKDCAFEELMHSIQTVIEQKIYLSPSITGIVVSDYLNQNAPEDKAIAPDLTAREREVLQLVAEGHSTKEIAATLQVSNKTVETHRQHIMDKLDLHSVAQLTKYAIRTGLTSLQD